MRFAFALLCVGSAFRSSKTDLNTTQNKISALYTWGAPKPTIGQLQFPGSSDGCFPGYRVVTEKDRTILLNKMDVVPTLAPGDIYDHIKTQLVVIDQKRHEVKDCGKRGFSINKVSIKLHLTPVYVAATQRVPEIAHTAPALEVSYAQNEAEAEKILSGSGYTHVAMAFVGKDDVSHLIQDASGRCIVTFEGSNSVGDWIQNFRFIPTSFCGLPKKFHRGFVSKIMDVVGSSKFQNDVRPKFSQCSSLEVAGHSLGGAMATLFAACSSHSVPAGKKGHEQNKLFKF